jgi:hypothetical protein
MTDFACCNGRDLEPISGVMQHSRYCAYDAGDTTQSREHAGRGPADWRGERLGSEGV